jgi:hypothetical protein
VDFGEGRRTDVLDVRAARQELDPRPRILALDAVESVARAEVRVSPADQPALGVFLFLQHRGPEEKVLRL